jgi:tetratricopeptide (TPR) repeat protein
MGFFDFIFGKKKLTLEEADKKNDAFFAKNPVAKNEENELMRNAAKLMSSKQFNECIAAYTHLAQSYPSNQGLYEGQIGAAYYFLDDYDKAVEYYELGLQHGANASMMDDNIWEAAEEFAKVDVLLEDGRVIKPKHLVERYIALFPKGNHIKKAQKALN